MNNTPKTLRNSLVTEKILQILLNRAMLKFTVALESLKTIIVHYHFALSRVNYFDKRSDINVLNFIIANSSSCKLVA